MQHLASRSLGETILKHGKQSCISIRCECVFKSGLYFYINLQTQENGVINVLGTTDRPFKAKADDTWDFLAYYTFKKYSWIRQLFKKQNSQWEYTVQHRELYLMHCGNLNGRAVQKGGDIYVCMADSFCCAVEANTTL